ncbi:MAG: lysophospholipid acyltransferase family protein [Nannocystaceae bacterium]|nr:1-acyl-sn-glycerol-3-phosphate acyltransferase [Myxococcales bacterium]
MDGALPAIARRRAGGVARALDLLRVSRRLSGDAGWLGLITARSYLLTPHRTSRYHAQARILAGYARRFCQRHGVEIDVSGAPPSRPSVLVANHLGYLDPLVLVATGPCLAIAKREVSSWPMVGTGLDRLGLLFVERGRPHSGARVLLRALAMLRGGVSILNFPEGTTTDGRGVLEFRRGIFGLARLADVPVVPIRFAVEDPTVCWIGEDTFLPHFLDLSRKARVRVSVRYGPPLAPGDFASASALAAAARAQIAARG